MGRDRPAGFARAGNFAGLFAGIDFLSIPAPLLWRKLPRFLPDTGLKVTSGRLCVNANLGISRQGFSHLVFKAVQGFEPFTRDVSPEDHS